MYIRRYKEYQKDRKKQIEDYYETGRYEISQILEPDPDEEYDEREENE